MKHGHSGHSIPCNECDVSCDYVDAMVNPTGNVFRPVELPEERVILLQSLVLDKQSNHASCRQMAPSTSQQGM